MAGARQARGQNVVLPIDVLGGGDDRFGVAVPRFTLDTLAKRDDRVVGAERRRQAIDVGEPAFDGALRRGGECRLVARHDLLLQREHLAIAIGRAPAPGRPLDLHAGKPVAVEAGIEEVEAGLSIASAAECRHTRPRLRRDDPLLRSELLATARELEVLGLIARGCSNREAAARLFISEATVKTHLLHIYAKLGVKDRAAAVAAGFERGLLTPGREG